MINLKPEQQLSLLNKGLKEEHLSALKSFTEDKKLMSLLPRESEEVNNHVHTAYSFSPYSPAATVWFARKAGLKAVGSMDHDSISAAKETLEAGKILGMATTVGFELRVNFTGTALEGRKFNNPDSSNIVYMTIHGVPESRIKEAEDFLKPLQDKRNQRNRIQCEKLNALIAPFGLEPLDFEDDIASLSEWKDGGSITERHILYGFSIALVKKFGKGAALVDFLENTMDISLKGKIREILMDEGNPHYLYDLLGILKGNYLPSFFVQPDEEECLSVYDVVSFANKIGGIPSYAYLGDVGESPTGDKKAEKFEDEFLDELIPELKKIGFKAITYMPPRNTLEQLLRVQKFCSKYELMEISGVDINSSRQSFNCPEILQPEFSHLITATWALIAHEKLTSINEKWSLFHKDNPLSSLSLNERISRYAEWGENMDRFHPEKIAELADFS
ncbi:MULTISPECIES: PHP domain-containing protein [unclassified Oceanispirochaeta]|uniref:PHP domain-containing protein n=1 Tax=unclassified Oceanispirochaeta TaxID=2635722 RepID=UPI000E08D8B7|nr:MULTISPECIES: PHP domain-containing protein [unclassified Oceanispirochaeta]MBF9014541.1 PHP domain-containing protein [Oceanispirochaeta sp. M2]NPD70797.1 PHP domain-containing protein [Oceanispirochaeta sp. M1]RDG34080.1 PHP domain-containing protein [Oceanispirochaeta sp. M1]